MGKRAIGSAILQWVVADYTPEFLNISGRKLEFKTRRKFEFKKRRKLDIEKRIRKYVISSVNIGQRQH